MREVFNFFKENPTFYIATMEGDQPRVRPFGAIAQYNGKFYITTSNQKKVFAQMQKNPKIEFCTMSKDGTWVRVEAEVIVDSSTEAREEMLKQNPNLNSIYSLNDGKFEVLYLKNATATFYSFTGEPQVFHF